MSLCRWMGLAANVIPRLGRNPWISLITAVPRHHCFQFSMTYSAGRRLASGCPRLLTKTW